MNPLQYGFIHASGKTLASCDLIGYRLQKGADLSSDRSDSWVIRFTDDACEIPLATPRWLTGLWQTPTGITYVTDADRRIYVLPPQGDHTPYTHHTLDASLSGVWGIDDTFVLAWGLRNNTAILFRWDGKEWREIASPGFLGAIHGSDQNNLFCVGQRGAISHWNGSAWRKVKSQTKGSLTSVFMIGKDEAWACGPQGDLLRGTAKKWESVLKHPFEGFSTVAFWHDALWIGASGALGLCVWKNQQLVSIKPKLHPTSIDTRGSLLLTCEDRVVESKDGTAFRSTTTDYFAEVTKNEPFL